jgi:ComF family protein
MKLSKKYVLDSLHNLIRTIKSVVNPEICPGCNEKTIDSSISQLCPSCWQQIPVTDHFSRNYINSVHEKFFGRFNLEFGAALWYFHQKGITGRIIHQYKYKKKKNLGIFIAKEICREMEQCSFLPSFDLITGVPVHIEKEKKRGYNQSTVIANYIGSHLAIPTDPNLLVKIIETDSQTKKSRKERLLNIANSVVIKLDKLKSVSGKKILIIDDTLTTGATIESCGTLLLKNGAKSVSVVCVCQAT